MKWKTWKNILVGLNPGKTHLIYKSQILSLDFAWRIFSHGHPGKLGQIRFRSFHIFKWEIGVVVSELGSQSKGHRFKSHLFWILRDNDVNAMIAGVPGQTLMLSNLCCVVTEKNVSFSQSLIHPTREPLRKITDMVSCRDKWVKWWYSFELNGHGGTWQSTQVVFAKMCARSTTINWCKNTSSDCFAEV